MVSFRFIESGFLSYGLILSKLLRRHGLAASEDYPLFYANSHRFSLNIPAGETNRGFIIRADMSGLLMRIALQICRGDWKTRGELSTGRG